MALLLSRVLLDRALAWRRRAAWMRFPLGMGMMPIQQVRRVEMPIQQQVLRDMVPGQGPTHAAAGLLLGVPPDTAGLALEEHLGTVLALEVCWYCRVLTRGHQRTEPAAEVHPGIELALVVRQCWWVLTRDKAPLRPVN